MLSPHRFRTGTRIEVGDRLREPPVETVHEVGGAWLRDVGRSAVAAADRDVAVRDQRRAWRHVPHHHLRLRRGRDVVRRDYVAVQGGVGGVGRYRGEGRGAV